MDDGSRFQERHHLLQQIMPQTDEISLVDMALVIMRRKGVLSSVMAACLLAGALYAWFKPLTYIYTTMIEIGAQFVAGEPQPLESPSSALAKIKASYIPLILQQYLKNQEPDAQSVEITASIPADSLLIRLESRGTSEKAATFQTIHATIAERLLQDHQRITDVIRKDMENDLNATQNNLARAEANHFMLQNNLQRMDVMHGNELAGLRDQAKVLNTERKRMEQTESLIKQQVGKYQHLIDTAEQNRAKSVNEVTDESRAMTLLMINNEIQQNRNQLLNLQERLSVGIPNERDRLAKAIEDNQRQQESLKARQANERDDLQQKIAENTRQQSEIKDQIEATRFEIPNLRQSRIVATATQSIEPAGPGPVLILALSVILGGILGIGLVLLLELIATARRRQAELAAG